jgi:phospholipase C
MLSRNGKLLAGLVCVLLSAGLMAGLLGCSGIADKPTDKPATSLSSGGGIEHIVVIVQENRTPDNLFHGLPGADIANVGINSAGETIPLTPAKLYPSL